MGASPFFFLLFGLSGIDRAPFQTMGGWGGFVGLSSFFFQRCASLVITNEWLDLHRTAHGAWSAAQLNVLGIKWPPPRGWKRYVCGMELSDESARAFIAGKYPLKPQLPPTKKALRRAKKKKAHIGTKQEQSERRVAAYVKNSRIDPTKDDFLLSFEWRSVRMMALKRYGPKCQCCGATPADGVKMHVDHIKPRKLFPHLALSLDNLQVLCEVCNHGKGNWDMTDWRMPAVHDGVDSPADAQAIAHMRSIMLED